MSRPASKRMSTEHAPFLTFGFHADADDARSRPERGRPPTRRAALRRSPAITLYRPVSRGRDLRINVVVAVSDGPAARSTSARTLFLG